MNRSKYRVLSITREVLDKWLHLDGAMIRDVRLDPRRDVIEFTLEHESFTETDIPEAQDPPFAMLWIKEDENGEVQSWYEDSVT